MHSESRLEERQVLRRTPEEDQLVFHRRFQEQGYLTDAQVAELHELAQTTYAKGPKSDCMIMLLRNPRQARRMVLDRGRPVEIRAWPESELRAMARFYEESGSGAMIKDLAGRLKGALQASNASTEMTVFDTIKEEGVAALLERVEGIGSGDLQG